jgi:hypothetical protein
VRLPSRLLAQFPEAMTIVLQHQFWDLVIGDTSFEVGMSFGGIPERLTVTFASIKEFVDPSVPFGVKFEQIAEPTGATVAPTATTASTTPTRPVSRSHGRAEADTHDAGARRSAAAGKRNGQAGIRRRSAEAGQRRRGREPRPVPQEMKRT